jgi:hypothetical protein
VSEAVGARAIIPSLSFFSIGKSKKGYCCEKEN